LPWWSSLPALAVIFALAVFALVIFTVYVIQSNVIGKALNMVTFSLLLILQLMDMSIGLLVQLCHFSCLRRHALQGFKTFSYHHCGKTIAFT
jgi:hypothetical protein